MLIIRWLGRNSRRCVSYASKTFGGVCHNGLLRGFSGGLTEWVAVSFAVDAEHTRVIKALVYAPQHL